MRGFLIYSLLLLQVTVFSQTTETTFTFSNYTIKKSNDLSLISFDKAGYDDDLRPINIQKLNGHFAKKYNLSSVEKQLVSEDEAIILKRTENEIALEPEIQITSGQKKGVWSTTIYFSPFFRQNGRYFKITSATLELKEINNLERFNGRQSFKSSSVLASGSWFKFKTVHSGIHEISFEQLKEIGILSEVIERKDLVAFSNSNQMVSLTIKDEFIDDLIQLPLKFSNQTSNQFGENDHVRLFINSGNEYVYENGFKKEKVNLYSDTNYIFIGLRTGIPEKLVTNSGTLPNSANTSEYDFNKLIHHEIEKTNFIKSGRGWVGEQFFTPKISFSYPYDAPLMRTNEVKYSYNVCARSSTSTDNRIHFLVNGDTASTSALSRVSSVFYNDYVKFKSSSGTETVIDNDSIKIEFDYQQKNNPLAWLDYFTLNLEQRLNTNRTQQLLFTNHQSNFENTNFNVLSSWTSPIVWDVSDWASTTELQVVLNDTGLVYSSVLNNTKTFVIANESDLFKPIFEATIANQNLHSLASTNYLVITDKMFAEEAEKLIDLHKKYDDLTGQVVFTDDIYNEFSSGRPEAGAIRNFIKMLYDRGLGSENELKYVCLFGDGSYDPKNRLTGNINLIPTYQSTNSVKLTTSFVTDDFYGLMDEGEGEYKNGDLLDLAVGRIPVDNKYEALTVVDKIYEYYDVYADQSTGSNKLLTSKGSWRNNILFVADDEDFNEHMRQANILADFVDTAINSFNVQKILLDAYPQDNTSIGQSSKSANKALIDKLHDGVLLVNYTGHGGELGWTDEQIFEVKHIKALENRTKLPLFMTATCEFSRFDNPEHTSAGEYLLLQKHGGSIALFTTVRLVFSIPNFRLNETFYEVLKTSIENADTKLGDIFRKTKVTNNGGTNDRNFTLLGDPALQLAFPLKKALIESVQLKKNDVLVATDTLQALSTGILKGSITNPLNGEQLNQYNGFVEAIIYDKYKNQNTLDNENTGRTFNFRSQNDILFKGRGEVINGVFKLDFVLPKNTRQNYDFGRIAIYADDPATGDANGFTDSIIIGGTFTEAIEDSEGPRMTIYLEDSTFSFGDQVAPNPLFIAQLTDSSGINTMNNDVGGDMILTIDDRNDLTFALNDFYTPSTKSFRWGEVTFPIENLEDGRHSLKFKAFDTRNNSSTAYTEFIIEENPKLALQRVLNYPNPFTTHTGFFFEHNQNSGTIEVLVSIYTISGKLIKTIRTEQSVVEERIGPIEWDGLDDFGDRIGRGVYVYKVEIRNDIGETANELQKLVLLR